MSKISKTYPINLQVRVSQEIADSVKALASRRGLPVAELTRRLIKQGISRDAARDAVASVENAVRRVIREELKTEHDLNYKAAFSAAMTVALIREFGNAEDMNAVEAAARQYAAATLRRHAVNLAEPAPLDLIEE